MSNYFAGIRNAKCHEEQKELNEMMKFWKSASFGLALAASCIAVSSSHAGFYGSVAKGDVIRFGNGPGADGEFNVLGSNSNATLFATFCVQTNEYMNFGPQFKIVDISQGSVGYSTQYLTVGASALYAQFAKAYDVGNVNAFAGLSNVGYDFTGSGRTSDANDLQTALWYYQGQNANLLGLLPNPVTNNKYINAVNSLFTSATAFTAAATFFATPSNFSLVSDFGNVSVLNLVWGVNDNGTPAQDQLYWHPQPSGGPQPVPEPATMVLFGFGAIGVGFLRRRRVDAGL